jgi:hypothetical protein
LGFYGQRKGYRTNTPLSSKASTLTRSVVTPTDVVDLGEDKYKIRATGQVIKRRKYSPDGEYYRCACDHIAGKWTVHPKANTRCLVVPFQGN